MDPDLRSTPLESVFAGAIPAGVLLLDNDGCVISMNRMAAELLGCDFEAAVGRPMTDLFDADVREDLRAHLDEARDSANVHRLEVTVSRSADDPRHVLLQTRSSPSDDGSSPTTRIILTEISAYVERARTAESARTAAERRADSSDDILAVLSHEIRSVLASMIGFADILQANASGENEDLAKSIIDSGRHLLDTLNAVIDLAQFDLQKANLEMEEIDVVRRARAQTALFRPMAAEKSLDLKFRADSTSAEARLNKTFLDRILYNLIENAIKYTQAGTIEVSVEERQQRVWIYVSDTGIGISEEFVPRLFSSFQREGPAAEISADGAGLGLAVTKRLVELMGGRITVCSSKGEGSTFTVTFPAQGR